MLLGIFGLAIFVRVLGIWHSYPYSYYGDEVHFVKRALSFGSGDLNPHWFHKPAFYMYFLFFEYVIFYVVGKIFSFWQTTAEYAVFYILNPGPFYLIGRATTTLFGLGNIWLVYLIGEKHFSKNSGIIASLLLCLSFGHVVSGQSVKADVPATFFAVLSLYFLLNYCKDPQMRLLVLSSVFAGMGTATKYYPIVMIVPIVFAILTEKSKNVRTNPQVVITKLKKIITILFVFYAFYFISAPYNFLDPLGRCATFESFNSLFSKVLGLLKTGRWAYISTENVASISFFDGFLDYVAKLFAAEGLGVVIVCLGILGIGYLLSTINRTTAVFLLFPSVFAFVSIFVMPGYAEPRHQVPVYPFVVVAAAAFVVKLAGSNKNRRIIIYTMLMLSLSISLYEILKRGFFVSRVDTRNIAKAWIENNIPKGSRILIDELGPQLIPNEVSIKRILNRAQTADPKGQFTAHYYEYLQYQLSAAHGSISYDIFEIRQPWWRQEELKEGVHELDTELDRDMGNPLKLVGVENYEFYVKNGFDYIVVYSDKYEVFLDSGSNRFRDFPSFRLFYSELFQKGKLVKEFSPEAGKCQGPTVKIFQPI